MKKQLLTETVTCLLEEITENKTDDRMRVRGLCMVADTMNRNGRVYPKSIVEREIGKLQKPLKEREAFGAADHPTDGKHRIPGTAAIHERLWMQGNEVWGEATILNTVAGKDLQEIIRAKGRVGISARGFGNLTEGEWEGKPAKLVGEDYELVTFDFVLGPGFQDATVRHFTEDVEDPQGGNDMTTEIKDVKSLREKLPALVKEIEDSLTSTVTAAVTEKLTKDFEQKVLAKIGEERDTIKAAVKEELAKELGVEKLQNGIKQIAEVCASILGTGGNGAADSGKDKGKDQGGVSEVVAAQMKALEEQLGLANKTIGQLEAKANKSDVRDYLEESLKTEPHSKVLQEALKDCKTVEEAKARLPVERDRIKSIIAQANLSGKGEVTDPAADDKGGDAGQLTESQKHEASLIPDEDVK